jgi:hypothetical protein
MLIFLLIFGIGIDDEYPLALMLQRLHLPISQWIENEADIA